MNPSDRSTRARLPLGLARAALAALLLSSATASAAEEGLVPAPKAQGLVAELPTSEKACLVCHTAPQFPAEAFQNSAHRKFGCTACHEGYDFSSHRAQAEELSAEDKELATKFKKKSASPRASLACRGCHEEAFTELVGDSIHGRWLREERPVSGPLCFDCHGSPHEIVRTKGDRTLSMHARSKRCVACHGDPVFMQKVGISDLPATSYRDSLHGRMVALGNERAPNCADCHGTHQVLDPNNPKSAVFGENKAKMCSKCHEGANESFASLVTHKPLTQLSSTAPHFIHAAFSYLTALTLLALFIHILLDVIAEVRRRVERAHGHGEPELPATLPREVPRFDIHQRIQHWLLISSVVLLVLTGWPVRAAVLTPGQAMASALGGPHLTGLVHRIAAVLLIAAAVYHVVYLVWLASQRKMKFSMAPAPKDLVQVFENMAYFVGLRREKPKFGRFSYIEKFDYWAVFWGVAIMVGTGFIYWFPVQFAHVVPGWMILGAQLAHGEEATLAALALFVWHFYNVHLRPSVFPMSWTWLDGKIPLEQLREEHGEEYDKLVREHEAKGKEGK